MAIAAAFGWWRGTRH